MGIRRVLTGAVLGLAGSALLALPAAAAIPDPYGPDPTPGSLSTSSTTVEAGEAVTVFGRGFQPGSTVTLTVTLAAAGFGRFETDSAPAPMGSVLAAGTTRAAAASVQRFAAAQTVTADAAGSFTTSVVLNQVGRNVITATGIDAAGNPRTLSTSVLVVAAGSGDGSGDGSSGTGPGSDNGVGGLPNTGADLTVPAVVGGALVLLGGAALLASRRRKQEKVAA